METMGEGDKPKRSVKTADTIFGIIEHIQVSDGATMREIAESLGLAESTVHTHLTTLLDKEYLVKREHKYYISLKFLEHGMYAKTNYTIANTAQRTLDGLAAQTGEAVYLIVPEHGRGVYISKSLGEHAVQTEGRVGLRRHLHEIAAGKAILAHLPEEQVDDILDRHGLPKKTEQTITDRRELEEELEEIRETGVAFNINESLLGERAVAAAIVPESEVVGAITVVGPANRLSGDHFREEIPDLLLGAVNEVELRLQFE
jgi:DNA-binding IclR family transcriptional regulator